MRGRRLGSLALAALVVVSALGAFAPTASAATGSGDAAAATSMGAYVTIGNVTVEPDDPVVGERTSITATFESAEASTESAEVTEVSVRGPSTFVTANDVGTLGPGTDLTVPFSTSFESAGEKRLTVTLRGIASNGSVFVVRKPIYVDVDEATVDPDLSASATVENGSSVLEATLAERGTVDLEDARIDAVVDGETVSRASIADVAAQGEQSVTFDGADVPTGNVSLVAHYTVATTDERASTETTLRYAPQDAGNMAITGLEVTGGGGSYTISGDASNLGSADAKSVVVSVVDTEAVSETNSYYVGEIETSEFATFEVSADVSGDVDSVPVRLDYAADGEEYSTVVDVDVDGTNAASANAGSGSNAGNAAGQSGSPSRSSGGPPVLLIGGGVIALLVVGVLVYRWRNP
ncbi:COG1361 family protein [Halarchaeum nitratireducens]|uniref:CARDB domain-containing protein n=1 Tax=Halarchaeum nitratireducens TaxID=489913 RepID=A0A830GBW3_9EURY|nr:MULTISPECIES: hypothetical protein [Halarchaeum]MBP2252097.1 hypothetical protein [Halarchaeum solikamskense]GGN16903.1 hypothetical protein GCM10009021_17010 [Halarchaeum nitratireducens]